jgi:hypothetical protein
VCRLTASCGSSGAGQSPEAIRSDFPTLSLEQVYGAITFYLGHKDQVDNDMAARERSQSSSNTPTDRSTDCRPPRFVIDGFERYRSEGEDRG